MFTRKQIAAVQRFEVDFVPRLIQLRVMPGLNPLSFSTGVQIQMNVPGLARQNISASGPAPQASR